MNSDLLERTRLTAAHALSLRRLIGAEETSQIAPTGSKVIMLAALRAAEIDILTTCAHVPVEDRKSRPICGTWTLHELIGHLADWDLYFTNWLAELRGEPTRDLFWDDDGDAFNRQLWQQRRGESWETTWQDFRANRTNFIDALMDVTDEDFMQVSTTDVPFPTVYHCGWSALEHYLDHTAGIRRSLNLALPEELLDFHGPYTE